MPLHIVRRTAAQKHRRAAQIGGIAPFARRNALEDRAVARLVSLQSRGIVGRDIARRNRIDVDALARPFIGEQLGQPANAALGRGIARHANAALKGQHRRDIDDLAGPFRDHVPPRRLAQEEHRFEIGVDHRIPIVLGKIDRIGAADDAGIVDENIETAELIHSLIHNPLHRLDRGEIGGNDFGAAPQRADLRHRVLSRCPPDTGHIRASRRQRYRNRLADAGIGPGDDGNLAGEIEGIGHVSFLSPPACGRG
ncbi:hypothetical protein D9M73_92470 [compost metagenome]